MNKPAPSPTLNPTPISCYSSVTGQPVLEARTVPTLDDALGEIARYAIARSDSLLAATRALGLEHPRELRTLVRKHNLRIPAAWSRSKKGGR